MNKCLYCSKRLNWTKFECNYCKGVTCMSCRYHHDKCIPDKPKVDPKVNHHTFYTPHGGVGA